MKGINNYSPRLTFSQLANKEVPFHVPSKPAQRSIRCQFHLQKNASYIDTKTNSYYCDNCSRQLTNRGRQMKKIIVSSLHSSFTDLYQKSQQTIKKHIQIYNSKITQLIQALTDLQIKDLMYYNDLLSTNEKIYEGNIVSSFLSISKEQIRKIYDIEKEIKKVLCNPLKSFETRATFDSKNRSTFSQNSSISLFNQVSFNESGKNSFINSEKERESNKQSNLEDTPEGLKSKLNRANIKKVKEINEPVEMFDKINICQSLQGVIFDQFPEQFSANKENNQIKKKGRYDVYLQE